MKYIVYVTSSIENTINGGNYRGEGRWERNVLDALLSAGRDCYMIDLYDRWKSNSPIPTNLHDVSEIEPGNTSLFISNSAPNNLDIPAKATYYALQWYNGPDNGVDGRFREWASKEPVVATVAYGPQFKKFKQAFSDENVVHIQGPFAPYIEYNLDNFNEKYLTVGTRTLESMLLFPTDDKMHEINNFLGWCCQKLSADKDLKLAILCGMTNKSEAETYDWFWQLPAVKRQLTGLEDRVELCCKYEWPQVLQLLRRTKLQIFPVQYGSALHEIAMFGIPPIILQGQNAVTNESGNDMLSPAAHCGSNLPTHDFLNLCDHLLDDHSYYRALGDAAREYTNKWATYEAYIRQLDELCSARGWT